MTPISICSTQTSLLNFRFKFNYEFDFCLWMCVEIYQV